MTEHSYHGAAVGRQKTRERQERLQALMVRDNGKCQHCRRGVRVLKLRGGQQQPADMATEDHVIQKCLGGSDDLLNLLLACFRCNNRRGDMTVEAFAYALSRGLK
jgi:5-methylcytosine-specific restriction endonuclease McrA